MEEVMDGLLVFLGIILLVVLIIYILQAILLNKLNKLMYGKGTPMAWIPVANIYLLGKLTVNKLVGWILVICCFSTGTVTTTVNGESTTTTLLPGNIGKIVSLIYSISVFVLFIYAIIKYFKLKKEKNSGYSVSNNSTVTSDGTTNLSNHTETVTSSQQPSTNIQSNGVQTQPAAPVNASANQAVQQPAANPQVSSTPVQPAAPVSSSTSQVAQQPAANPQVSATPVQPAAPVSASASQVAQQPAANPQVSATPVQPAAPVSSSASQVAQQPAANPQVSATPVQPVAPVSASTSQAVQQATTDSSQNQSVKNSDPFNW